MLVREGTGNEVRGGGCWGSNRNNGNKGKLVTSRKGESALVREENILESPDGAGRELACSSVKACTHTCGSQRLTSWCLFLSHSPDFWGRDSTELETHQLAYTGWQANLRAPSVAGSRAVRHAQLFMWTLRGSNSGPHVCVACTFPTGPPFQAADLNFKYIYLYTYIYMYINIYIHIHIFINERLIFRQIASEMDKALQLFNTFRILVIWTSVNQMPSPVEAELKPHPYPCFSEKHSACSTDPGSSATLNLPWYF